MDAQPLKIDVAGFGDVSGLWQAPASPSACLALAHGAGAGMTHRAMAAIADGLEARNVATLRYQFPFMEKGSKRPDAPALAQATVRAAAAEAIRAACCSCQPRDFGTGERRRHQRCIVRALQSQS